MFISSFCAALAIRSVWPLSFSRLPNISIPTSAAASGSSKDTMTVTKMGNKIFSSLETGRRLPITTLRSFLVVSARIMGG